MVAVDQVSALSFSSIYFSFGRIGSSIFHILSISAILYLEFNVVVSNSTNDIT